MPPAASVKVDGVIAIDFRVAVVAAVTVNPVLPVIEPETALTVALPDDTPVARPDALTVATAVLVEVQVAELVRFLVVPSL